MHRGVVTGHRSQWMVDSSLRFRNFLSRSGFKFAIHAPSSLTLGAVIGMSLRETAGLLTPDYCNATLQDGGERTSESFRNAAICLSVKTAAEELLQKQICDFKTATDGHQTLDC